MRDAPLYPAIVAIVLAKVYPVLSLYDEIFCLVAVFTAVISLVVKKYLKKRYLVFASIFSLFVLASFPWLSDVSNLDFVLSLLFLSKFFIFFIYIDNIGDRECRRLIAFTLVFTTVGLFVQLFYPNLHAQLIPRSLERGYLQTILSGFQTNPNYLAITICLFLVSSKRWLITKGAFFLALLSTGSRSGLGFAMLMIGAKKSETMSTKTLIIYMLFALGLSAIWLYFIGIFDHIVRDIRWIFDGIGSNLYIRGIVMNISLLMAIDFFPIGGGLGSFATPYSWESPVYDMYGVGNLHFFYEGSSAVFDSNLATVLGSSGVLGTLFFLISLRVLLNSASVSSRTESIFFVAIIFLSVFLPIFSNGYLTIIASLIWRLIREQGKFNAHTSGKQLFSS